MYISIHGLFTMIVTGRVIHEVSITDSHTLIVYKRKDFHILPTALVKPTSSVTDPPKMNTKIKNLP